MPNTGNRECAIVVDTRAVPNSFVGQVVWAVPADEDSRFFLFTTSSGDTMAHHRPVPHNAISPLRSGAISIKKAIQAHKDIAEMLSVCYNDGEPPVHVEVYQACREALGSRKPDEILAMGRKVQRALDGRG